MSWTGSAILSEPPAPGDLPLYRYSLSRDRTPRLGGQRNRVVWIGLNPSTADALDDDATIRKLKGFSERWGYEGFDIINVFAYRTKSPKVLLAAERAGVDIVGPENDLHMAAAIANATRVMACWGADTITKHRHQTLRATLGAAEDMGIRVMALRLTNAGEPYHPLYVKYDTKPFPFTLSR